MFALLLFRSNSLVAAIMSARIFWTLVLLLFDVFWIIFAFLFFRRANKTPEFLDIPDDRERHISNLEVSLATSLKNRRISCSLNTDINLYESRTL